MVGLGDISYDIYNYVVCNLDELLVSKGVICVVMCLEFNIFDEELFEDIVLVWLLSWIEIVGFN